VGAGHPGHGGEQVTALIAGISWKRGKGYERRPTARGSDWPPACWFPRSAVRFFQSLVRRFCVCPEHQPPPFRPQRLRPASERPQHHQFGPGNPRRVVEAGLLLCIATALRAVTVAPMPAGRGIALLADVADRNSGDGRPQRVVRRTHSVIPVPVPPRLRDEIRKTTCRVMALKKGSMKRLVDFSRSCWNEKLPAGGGQRRRDSSSGKGSMTRRAMGGGPSPASTFASWSLRESS